MKQKQTNGSIIVLGLFIIFLIIWAFFVADIRQREDELNKPQQQDIIVNFREQDY